MEGFPRNMLRSLDLGHESDVVTHRVPEQTEIAALRRSILEKLKYASAKTPETAKDRDWFFATALAIRDRIVDRWTMAHSGADTGSARQVCYLSLEFLIGRL